MWGGLILNFICSHAAPRHSPDEFDLRSWGAPAPFILSRYCFSGDFKRNLASLNQITLINKVRMKHNLFIRMFLLGLSACAFINAADAQKLPKHAPRLSESIVPPPSTPMSRAEIEAGLKSHDHALLISSFWIRDPYIVLGPDDYYYLTGTISPNDETRAVDADSERFSLSKSV